MDAQKTRAAVEAMAGHFAALNEAKEDCKANVDGVLELLVAESADPITRDDKRNLKRAAKALAKQTASAEREDAEQFATLTNEIGAMKLPLSEVIAKLVRGINAAADLIDTPPGSKGCILTETLRRGTSCAPAGVLKAGWLILTRPLSGRAFCRRRWIRES